MKHHPGYYLTQAILVSFGLIVLFLCMMATTLLAGIPPSGGERPIPLAIQRFNSDEIPDTLYGYRTDNGGFLPSRISWGIDSTWEPGSPPITSIIAGRWLGAVGSTSVLRIDDDDAFDVLIELQTTAHGVAPRDAPGAAGSADTSTTIAILGGDDLASQPQIVLDAVGDAQQRPFRAFTVRPDRDLVDGAVRDPAGHRSYVLPHGTTRVPRTHEEDSTSAGVPKLMLRPNPSGTIAVVDAMAIPAGNYRVVVTASDGASVLERPVTVDRSRRLSIKIDVTSIPAGYYRFDLRDERTIVASAPLVVVH